MIVRTIKFKDDYDAQVKRSTFIKLTCFVALIDNLHMSD